MAWTAPRTWVPGLTVTADILNAEVRDNLLVLKTYFSDAGIPSGFILSGRLAANLTKNANTTLADLTGLAFAIGASETWSFVAIVHLISSTTADAKFSVTAPAGAAGRFGVVAQGTTLTAGSAATFGNPVAVGTIGTMDEVALICGHVVNSTTAGTVQLQFAQNASDATNSIAYASSSIIAVRHL